MKTFAYCSASQRAAVARASRVEPLTSPPMHIEQFSPDLLCGRDLLYFSLHGLPDQPYWYGDDYLTAMSTEAFLHLDLSQTVVFVASCHFTAGPFLPAIRDCTPRAIIAGAGENYTRGESLVGANLLGYFLTRALAAHLPPRLALATARYRLYLHNHRLRYQLPSPPGRGERRPESARGEGTRLAQDLAANQDALHFEVIP